MPTLTDSQQKQIALRRQDPRPSFWNASASAYQEISPDFESYVITLEQGLRSKVSAVLRKSTVDASRQKDRDALMSIVIQAEINDSKKALDELDNALSAYTQLEQQLKLSAWADVPEVSMMSQDLRRGIDEASMYRRQAVHDYIVASIVQKNLDLGFMDDNIKQQMLSWSIPLGSY
jgi:hypothetical protein